MLTLLSTMSYLLFLGALFLGLVGLSVWILRKLYGTGNPLNWRNMLFLYLYVVLFMGALLSTVGASKLVRAGASYPLGLSFSYNLQPSEGLLQRVLGPELLGSRWSPPKDETAVLNHNRNQDIAQGVSFVAIGLLAGLVHLWGLRAARRQLGEPFNPLRRVFWILLLTVFTLLTLSAAVQGIGELVYYVSWGNRFVAETAQTYGYPVTAAYSPGEALGVALPALVGWLIAFRGLRSRALGEQAVPPQP